MGNMKSKKDITIPAMGVMGYNGALKGLIRCGSFFLSFMRERLTSAKTRRDAKLAAYPRNSTAPVTLNSITKSELAMTAK